MFSTIRDDYHHYHRYNHLHTHRDWSSTSFSNASTRYSDRASAVIFRERVVIDSTHAFLTPLKERKRKACNKAHIVKEDPDAPKV